MNRFGIAAVGVVVALSLGGDGQRLEPPLNPCAGGNEWILAEALAASDAVDHVTGISATLSPLVSDHQHLACEAHDDNGGWATAAVNIAAYDRRDAVGGEMLQVGLVRVPEGTWDAPTIRFWHTTTAHGSGLNPLPAPYPEEGRAYRFDIARAGGETWRMRITDAGTGEMLHEVRQHAEWSIRSAWVMFEASGQGARLGAWRERDAPSLSAVALHDGSRQVAARVGECYIRRARWEGGWVLDAETRGAQCSTEDGGLLRAFYSN